MKPSFPQSGLRSPRSIEEHPWYSDINIIGFIISSFIFFVVLAMLGVYALVVYLNTPPSSERRVLAPRKDRSYGSLTNEMSTDETIYSQEDEADS